MQTRAAFLVPSWIPEITAITKFPVTMPEGATPVPIPNTEVKPSRADDTAAARLWESRALPGSSEAHGCANPWAFLLALSTTVLHRGHAPHCPDEKEWSSHTMFATLGEHVIDYPVQVST